MENDSCEFELRRLRKENEDLKETIAVALNTPLLEKLKEAIDRINSGEYVTEEEFFKD